MKFFCIIFFALFALTGIAQTTITAAVTANTTSNPATTYTSGAETYNWGVSPNNATVTISSFTSGATSYSVLPSITGTVKMRKVNNLAISGNFTTLWAEAVKTGISPNFIYNIQPGYNNDMDAVFNSKTFNTGTDNIFHNGGLDGLSGAQNKNNIERVDFSFTTSYSTVLNATRGIAVFDRGNAGANDPFCIAMITAVDGLGNPSAYSNIIRVTAANYGNFGGTVSYRLYKAQYPSNLIDDNLSFNTQSRGGVFFKFSDFGITAGQTTYGYSLFATDFPIGGTGANVVDYTNSTYFPTTTTDASSGPGGLDLVAVAGVFIETAILPVKFISFNGAENNGAVNLNWLAANEINVQSYSVERSFNGKDFSAIGSTSYTNSNNGLNNSYSFADNSPSLNYTVVYYRIKENDLNGNFYYSATIAVNLKSSKNNLLIYPNPIKENLFVTLVNSKNEAATISIADATGRNVITKKMELVKGNNFFNVAEVKKLSKGIYVLYVKKSGNMLKQQFIKQ